MTIRCTPGKPKIILHRGSWTVFVPQVVFGGEASGTYHGPFVDWESARQGAAAITRSVLHNITMFNRGPIEIRTMN